MGQGRGLGTIRKISCCCIGTFGAIRNPTHVKYQHVTGESRTTKQNQKDNSFIMSKKCHFVDWVPAHTFPAQSVHNVIRNLGVGDEVVSKFRPQHSLRLTR